ncbi:VanZ family protein [Verrucomicrobia bacterium]|jgi:VanZ family protein|nr:VanZ family protein [Verrucomicrobiota bacterium]MDB4796600.1 VanZ family protein [bacterium]MDB4797974.1 VanZ family protein [Verrucomicrobiota bacterium]
MELVSKTRNLWVSSRRAILYWSVIGVIVIGVIVNGLTGYGSDISKTVQENNLMDKVGHLVFFGALSFLIHRGLRLHLTCSTWIVVVAGCAIACVLGVVDEYSQLWIQGRNFDYTDLWANFAGAALFGPLGCLMIEERRPSSPDPEPDPFESAILTRASGKSPRPSVFLPGPNASPEKRSKRSSGGHRRRSKSPCV